MVTQRQTNKENKLRRIPVIKLILWNAEKLSQKLIRGNKGDIEDIKTELLGPEKVAPQFIASRVQGRFLIRDQSWLVLPDSIDFGFSAGACRRIDGLTESCSLSQSDRRCLRHLERG